MDVMATMSTHVTHLSGSFVYCECGWKHQLPPTDAWLAVQDLAWKHCEAERVCPSCAGTCRVIDPISGDVATEDDYQVAACGSCDGAVCNCPAPFPGGWSWHWRYSVRPDLRLLTPHDYGMLGHRSAATLGLRVGVL